MIFTVAGKELRALFSSPLAWVVLAFLQISMAWILVTRLDAYLTVQTQLMQMDTPPGVTEIIIAPIFGAAAVILIMAVPLLSMRLIAEERRNQTMTFLISAPLSMTQIVIGKFIGLYSFLMLSVALILLMAASMYLGGRLDLGLLGTLSLGLALLIAAFAAVGVFFSSLTAQPVVAATATLATLLGLWLLNMSQANPDSPFLMLALIRRYESFTKGMIDSGDIIFLLVFTAVFLILAIRRLDSDRLGG
ncbi:MAG: ABC transporter permease subunit [Burkholderiales bacterium]|jgi:ABC-2 type transport system permease protein|nr:ABC transporter permease subunit [Burkholderiales bacterium]